MLATNRIFSTLNTRTGLIRWYFHTREGNNGPFETKALAAVALKSYIHSRVQQGDTGGRGEDHNLSPAALKVQSFIKYDFRARSFAASSATNS